MSNEFDPKSYLQQMQSLLELDIPSEWEEQVLFHLLTAKKMYDACSDAALSDHTIDFASCFNPGAQND